MIIYSGMPGSGKTEELISTMCGSKRVLVVNNDYERVRLTAAHPEIDIRAYVPGMGRDIPYDTKILIDDVDVLLRGIFSYREIVGMSITDSNLVTKQLSRPKL